jgi:hypothetical protein
MSIGTTSACSGAPAQDPEVIVNPPGLAQISYQVDDFTGFRRALLRPLPSEQAIGTWRPVPGDLGLQVLEWWAYLGDVLTFYNERIANESYLRTATQPASVANLVALLGYQPAPGIAASGYLAAVRSTAHPAEPLIIPAGLRLSSVATPGIPSQTFEVGAAGSFSGPSNVPVSLPPDTALARQADGTPQSVLLAGRVSGIRAGDRLILVDSLFTGRDDGWSPVTVAALTPTTDPGTGVVNTLVTFAAGRPLPSAPATRYRLLRAAAATALWNQGATGPGQVVVEQTGSTLTVQLSAAVRGISPGDLVLFDLGAGAPSALSVVAGIGEALWTVPYPVPSGVSPPSPPDIVVAHTALTLLTADSATLQQADPTTVAVRYGFKDVGTIIGVPPATLASFPATVAAPATYAPPPGTTAFLQDATGAGVLVQVSGAGTGQVTLTSADASTPPTSPELVAPLQLLLDVVPVSRGTTVTGEVLGSGNGELARQSYSLAQSPLTYLASGDGPASTLSVYVDGVEWQEVPSFYGRPANARVFVVSRSPDQTVTTVTFGDGINGARLPSGAGNVVATYRYGSGSASPPAGRLTTISQPQPNLASIQNPVAVSGGTDPQGAEGVRASAPATVFTFGRVISATDYEVVAAQAPGVTRVAARWTFDGAGQRTLVTVYVGGAPAAAGAASVALAGVADPNRLVSVVGANPIELGLSCTLVVAADRQTATVIAAATTAICDPAAGLFSPGRMGIGQRLYRSAVAAALMGPGVIAVHDLAVTWAGRVLDDVFDPGDGSFFDLPPGKVTIEAANADA